MIKIIKPGTRKTYTCQTCGCEFSYEEEDIKTCTDEPAHPLLESLTHGYSFVNCPQCDIEIVLNLIR